jgi:hypothetical protein
MGRSFHPHHHHHHSMHDRHHLDTGSHMGMGTGLPHTQHHSQYSSVSGKHHVETDFDVIHIEDDSSETSQEHGTRLNRLIDNLNLGKLQKRVKIFERGGSSKSGEQTDHNNNNNNNTSQNSGVTSQQSGRPQQQQPKKFSSNHMALSSRMFSNPNFYSKMLFTIYMLTKLFYIINCFAQFLLLNKFIAGEFKSDKLTSGDEVNKSTTSTTSTPSTPSTKFSLQNLAAGMSGDFLDHNSVFNRQEYTYITTYSFWRGFEFGYKSLVNLVQNGNLFGERHRLIIFHTVVFCDFKIRMLGDRLHRHTVQCVVPINIYTEKIFTILWFWLLFLNVLNVYNFLKWLAYFVSFRVRFEFIAKHLLKTDYVSGAASTLQGAAIGANVASFLNKKSSPARLASALKKSKLDLELELINSMTQNYLMHDNIFIIKLISKNTNEMITRELVTLLLENYKRKSILRDENTAV